MSFSAPAPKCRLVGNPHYIVHGSYSTEVNGSYEVVSQHHGRPAYKKIGAEMFLYYHDFRDGACFAGWWFGLAVGSDSVLARHTDATSLAPPPCGWAREGNTVSLQVALEPPFARAPSFQGTSVDPATQSPSLGSGSGPDNGASLVSPSANHSGAARGKKRQLELSADATTFAELRARFAPRDPGVIKQALAAQPQASNVGTDHTAFLFKAPAGSAPDVARWHLWLAIAECGFFPWQLYIGTKWCGAWNCAAGVGSNGQCTIFADGCTIIWLQGSGRLYCPSSCPGIVCRLSRHFPGFPTGSE